MAAGSPAPGRFGFSEFGALWALAVAASALVGTHGLLYWDAGDYIRLVLDGGTSGLMLGRPLFLLVSRWVLAVGVDAASAEVVLRWFWTVIGALAAPALALLAWRLGVDRRASLIAGVALAMSPTFAHTAHQVLTDAPALALSLFALAAAARSQAIASGLLLAAAVATRETTAVHAVGIILLMGRRSIAALGIATIAVAAIIWLFPPPGLAEWVSLMSKSAAARPIDPKSVAASIGWVFAAGPVTVIVGAMVLWRARGARWFLVAAPSAVATLLLLFYPAGSFSPRYVLATVPVAFFIGAGLWLATRPAVIVAAALVIPLAAMPIATQRPRAMARFGAGVMQRVVALPPDVLIVPGHYCPEARLAMSIQRRRDAAAMCPGWEWPADPAAALDAALASGRPVAIDLSDEAWLAPHETPLRDAVRAWARSRSSRLVAGYAVIER